MAKTYANELEEFVDKAGLESVLDDIADICALKAEHIRHTWQDERLARSWDKVSDKLNRIIPFAGRL